MSFLNEVLLLFLFAAEQQIFFLLRSSKFFIFPTPRPCLSSRQGCSVLVVVVEISDVVVAVDFCLIVVGILLDWIHLAERETWVSAGIAKVGFWLDGYSANTLVAHRLTTPHIAKKRSMLKVGFASANALAMLSAMASWASASHQVSAIAWAISS